MTTPINAARRLKAQRLSRMMVGYEMVAKSFTNIDDVAVVLEADREVSFQFRRTVKNVLDFAPVLKELAGLFRVHGFLSKSPTHFRDGNWQADISLDNQTIVVTFKPL